MKSLIKYWLRKFCGGNLHQVLGHLRAFRSPGDSPLNPRLRVPVVMSGKRYWILGSLNDLKPFIHEAYPFDVITARDRLLWPILPVLIFGSVFNIADPHPLAACLRRLGTRARVLWTQFKTKVAWCWDFCFGPYPTPTPAPKDDLIRYVERMSDRLWNRIAANWPGRIVLTTGTCTFPHRAVEPIRFVRATQNPVDGGHTLCSVPNPEWTDAPYEIYEWTADPVHVGPSPAATAPKKAKKSSATSKACKRTLKKLSKAADDVRKTSSARKTRVKAKRRSL